jgi:hypothetical protein
MTVEIDLERIAEVVGRIVRHLATVESLRHHVDAIGRRTQLEAEVAPVLATADRLCERLTMASLLLTRRAQEALQADDAPAGSAGSSTGAELAPFAGGSALCSAIQFFSPIPSRPSTTGTAGAIDAAGVARDVGSLAASAAAPTIAGRTVPLASIVAAVADVVLCRAGVGSGAAISTRKIVDEDGKEVFEGSRSSHAYVVESGVTLSPNLVQRDRDMWNAEHTHSKSGLVLEPYPGYPAYEVNAPTR